MIFYIQLTYLNHQCSINRCTVKIIDSLVTLLVIIDHRYRDMYAATTNVAIDLFFAK
jgi:hypothetical protein